MRYLVCTSVAAIVHYQGTGLLLLLQQTRNVGISVARRRAYTRISVPHYTLNLYRRVYTFHRFSHFLGITHVAVAVAVVAHEDAQILPTAGILVLGVTYSLVDHNLSFSLRAHGETSYGYIELVGFKRIAAFTIIKTAEETVVYITLCVAEGVFALVTKKEVVRIQACTLLRIHAVVPYAITEKQQV